MGVGSGLYMYDVVVKRSRSLSHLLMSSCLACQNLHSRFGIERHPYTKYGRPLTDLHKNYTSKIERLTQIAIGYLDT